MWSNFLVTFQTGLLNLNRIVLVRADRFGFERGSVVKLRAYAFKCCHYEVPKILHMRERVDLKIKSRFQNIAKKWSKKGSRNSKHSYSPDLLKSSSIFFFLTGEFLITFVVGFGAGSKSSFLIAALVLVLADHWIKKVKRFVYTSQRTIQRQGFITSWWILVKSCLAAISYQRAAIENKRTGCAEWTIINC